VISLKPGPDAPFDFCKNGMQNVPGYPARSSYDRTERRFMERSVMERIENMKILVTTPTGKIGRSVVLELLSPEFSVRVIVREPARLPEEVREQAEVVRGSTDDAETLRQALDGVEALFWCVPPESPQETNVLGHTSASRTRRVRPFARQVLPGS
jgi:hypothetical protein